MSPYEDPKVALLKRLGIRIPNAVERQPLDKKEIKARRKAERDRKRDQRRKERR